MPWHQFISSDVWVWPGCWTNFAAAFFRSKLLAHWLLTLDFKLAFFRMLFEVDEDADDEEEKNCGYGSTSDARRLEHDTRSSSCCEKIIFSLDSALALSCMQTYLSKIRRDPCNRTSVQCIRPYTRSCRGLPRRSWQRSRSRRWDSTTSRKLQDTYTYGMWYLVLD